MSQLDLLAYRSLEPDICFLIDIPAKIAYNRYIEREQSIKDNGLDLMNLKYFVMVVGYYKIPVLRGFYTCAERTERVAAQLIKIP